MTFHEWIEAHRPQGTVLDVGCGAHLHGRWGIDLRRIASIVADGTAIPVRHGALDGVVCAQVLPYTEADPIAILREIHRVLRPGGILLLTAQRWSWSPLRWDRLLSAMGFEVASVLPPRRMWSYRGWLARRGNLPIGRDWDKVAHRHRWVPTRLAA